VPISEAGAWLCSADVLERPPDAEPRDAVGRQPGDVAAEETDRAGRRQQKAGEHIEERRLAGAVRPDHTMDR